MNATNLTINFSMAQPVVNTTRMTDLEFARQYCEKLDMNIFIYFAVFFAFAFIIQLAYRMRWIDDRRYISLSQSFMACYIAAGVISLVFMAVRAF